MTSNVSAVFGSLRETLEKQDAVRDVLRERRDVAEVSVRTAQHALVTLHTTGDLKSAISSVKDLLSKSGAGVKAIEEALPAESGSFFRYADIWSIPRQTISMIAVIVEFVEGDRLPDVPDVQQLAGAKFRLPLEDFLIGLCNAVSELVRLSMNRVIQTDYATPARCAVFATHIFDAFKELNFRNDFLRKRYDGIKYDIKRLEEIVYDLSIRGLLVNNTDVGVNPCSVEERACVNDDDKDKLGSSTAPIDLNSKNAVMDTAE